MSERREPLYHLVRASEWDGNATTYAPPSLAAEGFIHFSTAEQLPATSMRYYADVDDLLVITVDPSVVAGEIVWEDLAGNGDFPHLYGPLELTAVTAVTPYRAGDPFPR